MAVAVGIPGYAKSPGESAYPQLWRGLVAWYPGDPRGHDMIHGYDLTEQRYTNLATFAQVCGAPAWDVSADRAGVHHPAPQNPSTERVADQYTVAMWACRTTSVTGTAYHKFGGVSHNNTDSSPYQICSIGTNVGGWLTMERSTNATGHDFITAGSSAYKWDTLATNKWYFLCGTTRSGDAKLYFGDDSGVSVIGTDSQTYSTLNTSANSEIYLGFSHTGSASSIGGAVTNLQLWNRALTAAEVELIYRSGPTAEYFKRRPLYFPTGGAAAVGGNALPMAMNLYRRLRS